ncbi:MAG: hypothetical protein KF861_05670, partial [Planctomycetaceae bacterium]|nr:hypothetical protein [Planctomycetaceae bacterium]
MIISDWLQGLRSVLWRRRSRGRNRLKGRGRPGDAQRWVADVLEVRASPGEIIPLFGLITGASSLLAGSSMIGAHGASSNSNLAFEDSIGPSPTLFPSQGIIGDAYTSERDETWEAGRHSGVLEQQAVRAGATGRISLDKDGKEKSDNNRDPVRSAGATFGSSLEKDREGDEIRGGVPLQNAAPSAPVASSGGSTGSNRAAGGIAGSQGPESERGDGSLFNAPPASAANGAAAPQKTSTPQAPSNGSPTTGGNQTSGSSSNGSNGATSGQTNGGTTPPGSQTGGTGNGGAVDLPPVVTVQMATGSTTSSVGTGVGTNLPVIIGTATDDFGITRLEARLDSGPFQNITSSLISGQFRFETGALPVGNHVVTIRATDTTGQVTDRALTFSITPAEDEEVPAAGEDDDAPPAADDSGSPPADLFWSSLASIGTQIANYRDQIAGLTVITHGFQAGPRQGDSLFPLASAIRDRADLASGADQTAWLLDYDLRAEGTAGFFDLDLGAGDDGLNNGSILTGTPRNVVLLFDWAPESNEPSSGWGEAAGDALFNLLVGTNLISLAAGAQNPALHFIAHSFGTAVTSEAVERLAAHHIPVDQVTLLDPHDFDESLTVDTRQRLWELGQPVGYGAAVWNNVNFTDVYYETRGANDGSGFPDAFVPEGRPIPGAYNRLLRAGGELPSLNFDLQPNDIFAGPYALGFDG